MASDIKTPLEEGWIIEREKALAWLRLAFAILAVIVIQLNPSRVARFPALSTFSLATFLLYSTSILYLLRKNRVRSTRLILVTTPLDVLWIALIVLSTGGSRTPFFTYYSFPVISASLRWGIKGSLPVAFTGVAIYFTIRLTLRAESGGEPIGIDTVVVRCFYLIALACIFGYISEFEKRQNQKLLALSRTAGQISALQERRRIMFDLHDGILQSLATLILRLESCRGKLADRPKDSEIESDLRSMEELTRDSMNEIRQFLSGKETKPLVHGTLLKRLREELRFLQQGLNMEVILGTDPEDVDLPETVETEIYYVLREGLANVTRHSHASRIDLQLIQKIISLEGNIEDNGAGMNLASMQNGQGLGLQSMRERIKKIGGELLVKSSPGGGTKISFTVPLTN
ncbi:MAG: sensor histidine kinase [Deltaproteobacteria bacterium]|nr:sensor histidine kinase [Deltaproteobacteria bacterium]